jgi:hypothetical protein
MTFSASSIEEEGIVASWDQGTKAETFYTSKRRNIQTSRRQSGKPDRNSQQPPSLQASRLSRDPPVERGPLIGILESMKGTELELNVTLDGEASPIEIRNVVDVEPLMSSQGIKITTKQNYIWIDAGHVSAVWQARDDL